MLAATFQDGGYGSIVGTMSLGRANTARYFEVGAGAPQITLSRAFAGPKMRYIDNVGVVPDETVALDPAALAAGHDNQLESAIDVICGAIAPFSAPTPGNRRE